MEPSNQEQKDNYTKKMELQKKGESLKDCFLEEVRRNQLYILNLLFLEKDEEQEKITYNLIDGLERAEKLFYFTSSIPSFCFLDPSQEFLESYLELEEIFAREKIRLGVNK